MPGLRTEAGAFLDWMAGRGRTANTLAAYRRDLEAYGRFLDANGRAVADVTEADVSAYVGTLAAAGRRSSSMARALVTVRALHRFCGTDPAGPVGAI